MPDKLLVNVEQLDGVEVPSTTFNLNSPQSGSIELPSIEESLKPDFVPEPPIPPKREVPYGEHFTKGKNGRRELVPDVVYITEAGYRYTTDSLGRISEVEVDELLLKSAPRKEKMQKVAGREDRLADDHGGHLIASMFNGSGDIDNLVAMNGQINSGGGVWYEMEKSWREALTEVPPKKVSVNIEPIYANGGLRPTEFKVSYQIEGKRRVETIIRNQAGG